MLKTAIVAAVSTREQAADDKYSIPIQLTKAKAVCEARGWSVVREIVIPGHSRDYIWLHELIRDCAEYSELIDLIASETINLIVVAHYDRLWSNSTMQSQVSAFCREHHVQIYSVEQPREPIDPNNTPKRPGFAGAGEVLSGILRDEEQNIRVARHRTGMAGRIRQGRHCIASVPPYGYRRNESGDIEPDPAEAPWVQWIFSERCKGRGYYSIASELVKRGVPAAGQSRRVFSFRGTCTWQAPTVARILRNRFYIGEVAWGDFRNPNGTHQPLITQEEFARAQEIREQRLSYTKPRTMYNNWLIGLVRCGYCNGSMGYYRASDYPDTLYLRCNRYVRTHGTYCQYNHQSCKIVHGFVLGRLYHCMQDPEGYLAMRTAQLNIDKVQSELKAVQSAIADCQARIKRWEHAYEVGAITLEQWLGRRTRIEQENAEWVPRERELETVIANSASVPADVLAIFPEVKDSLLDAPSDILQRIARAMIRYITLTKEADPVIYWR